MENRVEYSARGRGPATRFTRRTAFADGPTVMLKVIEEPEVVIAIRRVSAAAQGPAPCLRLGVFIQKGPCT